MDIEEVVIRKYKGVGNVLYNTRKEAEDSFVVDDISSKILYRMEDVFERRVAAKAILEHKDRLLKILQEIK